MKKNLVSAWVRNKKKEFLIKKNLIINKKGEEYV